MFLVILVDHDGVLLPSIGGSRSVDGAALIGARWSLVVDGDDGEVAVSGVPLLEIGDAVPPLLDQLFDLCLVAVLSLGCRIALD